MMQTADRSNDLTILFERLKRPRKLIVFPWRRNLIVQRMDAVGKVDEGTAPRRLGLLLGRTKRDHAFQIRERNARTHRTKSVPPVD